MLWSQRADEATKCVSGSKSLQGVDEMTLNEVIQVRSRCIPEDHRVSTKESCVHWLEPDQERGNACYRQQSCLSQREPRWFHQEPPTLHIELQYLVSALLCLGLALVWSLFAMVPFFSLRKVVFIMYHCILEACNCLLIYRYSLESQLRLLLQAFK